MKKRICHIVAASEIYGEKPYISENDLLIAADGGLKHLEEMGIDPDIVVGDFDSYKNTPHGKEIRRLDPIKDDTDTLKCVKIGLERGYKNFVIYGGMGGRFSHTLANLQTLLYICMHEGSGFLIGESELVSVVIDKTVLFDKHCCGFISLFAMGDSAIVTEQNLKYTLDEYSVKNYFPIGVSNEFIGEQARITVKGAAAIIYDKKNGLDAISYS